MLRFRVLELERNPSMFADLVSSVDIVDRYAVSAAGSRGRVSLRERANSVARGTESIDGLVADLRRGEMVRIAWRRIGGLAVLDETIVLL